MADILKSLIALEAGLLALAGAIPPNAMAADTITGAQIRLADVRARELSDCSAGYSKRQQHVEGKYIVYECVKTIRCASGFKAEKYEVVEEDGVIRQRYRCSALDKSQMININRNPDKS